MILKRYEVEHLLLKSVTTVFALIVLCLSSSGTCKADEYVSIKIFPEHVGVFTTVGKQQFVAYGYTSSGTAVNITKLVQWTSSDKSKVTIDKTGMATVVKGQTAGQVKITCSYTGGTVPPGDGSAVLPISLLLLSKVSHKVTPSTSGNGSISPAEVQSVQHNATTQLIVTPDPGYHIDSVGGTCGGALVDNTFTTDPVVEDCTVMASFAIDTFTLTYGVGTCESVTGDTPQTVNNGTDGTEVSVVAAAGTHFFMWSDGNTDNPRKDTNVTASIAVTATCEAND